MAIWVSPPPSSMDAVASPPPSNCRSSRHSPNPTRQLPSKRQDASAGPTAGPSSKPPSGWPAFSPVTIPAAVASYRHATST